MKKVLNFKPGEIKPKKIDTANHTDHNPNYLRSIHDLNWAWRILTKEVYKQYDDIICCLLEMKYQEYLNQMEKLFFLLIIKIWLIGA